MDDNWELAYGLNPTDPADFNGDLDNDGLTNLLEYQNSTNPNSIDTGGDQITDYQGVIDFFTDPTDQDTDRDALSDGWELANGTHPLVKNFMFSIVNQPVAIEGDAGTSSFQFTVNLNIAAESELTVDVNTLDGTATAADGDYLAITDQTLTFSPGDLSKTVTVSVNGDTKVEPDETFTVQLSNVVGTNAAISSTADMTTGTITNDDAAALTITDVTAEEGTDLQFTVSLNNAVASAFTVDVSFTDVTATGGADYTNSTIQLNFIGTAGEMKTFTVNSVEDAIWEGDETFLVNMIADNALIADTDTAIGAITNDDPGLDEYKLLPSDGATYDRFGYSVSASGNRIAVGAYGDNDNGNSSGSVYVYDWDDTQWNETKLTPSDGAGYDRFGYSVSLSGDRIVVGAHWDGDNGNASGSIYVYDWDGTQWNETKLTPSDGAAYDSFGYSVSLSGDRIAAGAYGGDDNGNSSGSVYVYRWDGAQWHETKLTPSDGAAYDSFGSSVSLSGDRIAVGVQRDDDNGNYSGSVYVHDWDGNQWNETKLTASDGAVFQHFGISVSLSDDDIAVGAYGDGNNGTYSGSIYIFSYIAPTLVNNEVLIVNEGNSATISLVHLSSTDIGTDDNTIIYTLTNLPENGTLLKNGIALNVNDAFTQADVIANLITYTYNGNNTSSDSFKFDVSDTNNNALQNQTFTIDISSTFIDLDGDGIDDNWELAYGLNPTDPADFSGDLDNDGLTNLLEYQNLTNPNLKQVFTSNNPGNSYDGLLPVYDAASGHGPMYGIQNAIDLTSVVAGHEVVVLEGNYAEDINFHNKAITVSSRNPTNLNSIKQTVISGDTDSSIVTFNSGENSLSVLQGLTISAGAANSKRGIYCAGSSPTIMNCFIYDNNSTGSGAGIYCLNSSPFIMNTILVDNHATGHGGAIFCDSGSPEILSCTIIDNVTASGAGIYGINSSIPKITNSIIPKITNSIIPKITNSIIPKITNSIILNNIQDDIEVDVSSDAIITGCLVDANYINSSVVVDASNIADGLNPSFVNPALHDYHLRFDSPIIDKGVVSSTVPRDIDGESRIDDPDYVNSNSAIFDIGADEYVDADNDDLSDWEEVEIYLTDPNSDDHDGDGMTDGWEAYYGLDPKNAADANGDLDNDGLTNKDEYLADTNPDNPDTDGDQLTDSDEINIYGADPTNSDSDGDTLADGWEIIRGLNPSSAADAADIITTINAINSAIAAAGGADLVIRTRQLDYNLVHEPDLNLTPVPGAP